MKSSSNLNNLKFFPEQKAFKRLAMGLFLSIGLLLVAFPAFAHHGTGAKIPTDFFQGFMSGIAHPLIGIDHFAFILSVGLLAATQQKGVFIPISFVLAAMLGAGIHLAGFDTSGIELWVSGSVLLFGILLSLKNRPNTTVIVLLSAIAGIFHGYAYGESIFGADSTPLFAYLLGFTVIQLLVIMVIFALGKKILSGQSQSSGLVLSGVGLAFLSSEIINVIFTLIKI
ncbi:MAG: HupE/UreJ family protein [Snowella sp.]|nr:HupE/UreJ family protein [Snowella sp.]